MSICTPTLAGFQTFIDNQMQIDPLDLPPQSPVIAYSFDVAMASVNCVIQQASPILYQQAVYNLAADFLINWAHDIPMTEQQEKIQGYMGFFAKQRNKWGLNNFAYGVVNSTSDVSTSTSLTVPEAASLFTVSDIQNLKTPFGRAYIAIAQQYGTIWALS